MAREFARSRRVEEQIQRLLSDVMRAELRDPRVAGVVITEVRASRDLGVAWIQYTLLGTDASPAPEVLADVQAGLDRAAGFLRSQLARQLATLDQMLGGRLTVNIISSDLPGETLESAPRYQRTLEVMQIVRTLLKS